MVAHWSWRVTHQAGRAASRPLAAAAHAPSMEGVASARGVQRPKTLEYQIYPPSSPIIWYSSNWNALTNKRAWKLKVIFGQWTHLSGGIGCPKWQSWNIQSAWKTPNLKWLNSFESNTGSVIQQCSHVFCNLPDSCISFCLGLHTSGDKLLRLLNAVSQVHLKWKKF